MGTVLVTNKVSTVQTIEGFRVESISTGSNGTTGSHGTFCPGLTAGSATGSGSRSWQFYFEVELVSVGKDSCSQWGDGTELDSEEAVRDSDTVSGFTSFIP